MSGHTAGDHRGPVCQGRVLRAARHSTFYSTFGPLPTFCRCVGGFIWWAWGYGAAYQVGGGANAFIGVPGDAHGAVGWVADKESASGADFASWWFQYVFAAAAATIVSGAMAERAQLGAYIIYTTVITGLIYPVIVHWVWDSNGWASSFNPDALMGGAIDFAGARCTPARPTTARTS